MIFDARLRQEKISSARFGQRLTIVLTNDWCDCVCGKRPITGLHCAEPDRELFCSGSRAGCDPMSSQATRIPLQIFISALDVERWPRRSLAEAGWTFDVSPEENETLPDHRREPGNWSRNRGKARRQRRGAALARTRHGGSGANVQDCRAAMCEDDAADSRFGDGA